MTTSSPRRLVAVLAGVLVAYLVAGAGGGWLWERVWVPTRGVVSDGRWFRGVAVEDDRAVDNFSSLTGYFDATAVYVVIGAVTALVLAVAIGLMIRRAELGVLLVALIGSAAAAYLSYRVGIHLSPPDPTVVARTADDGTILEAALASPGRTAFVAWPFGTLAGLGATYVLTLGAHDRRERSGNRVPGSDVGLSTEAHG